MKSSTTATIASFLALAAAFGFTGYIGLFGGPVFTNIAATGQPKPVKSHVVAVIFSGDMGFKIGMGPQIAQRLAADGIPVVGVNSLIFFRRERRPSEIRRLVSDATRQALAFGHGDAVVLIGQSFGADILQFGLTGMPPALRAKVRMVGLVVPTTTVFFRASPSELFNWAQPDASALPTARALIWTSVVCIHGIEESRSLCPQLIHRNIENVALPGGHLLRGNANAVYAVLSKAIDRASPSHAVSG